MKPLTRKRSVPSIMHAALLTLPHGPAFRFVDALDALVPGRSGAARYLLRGDEAFLDGHFPGAPLMPGVLLIEALAQLGGIIAQSDPDIPPLPDLRLAAVHNAKSAALLAGIPAASSRADIPLFNESQSRIGKRCKQSGMFWGGTGRG